MLLHEKKLKQYSVSPRFNTTLAATTSLNRSVLSPFLGDSLYHCATFPGCVDDLNVIWGKLNQIPQGTWLNDGRVSDEVLLKIHWLHGLCEGNLREIRAMGKVNKLWRCGQVFTSPICTSSPFFTVHKCLDRVLKSKGLILQYNLGRKQWTCELFVSLWIYSWGSTNRSKIWGHLGYFCWESSSSFWIIFNSQ